MQFNELKPGQKFRFIYNQLEGEPSEEVKQILADVHSKYESVPISEEEEQQMKQDVWMKLDEGWTRKERQMNAICLNRGRCTNTFDEAPVEIVDLI